MKKAFLLFLLGSAFGCRTTAPVSSPAVPRQDDGKIEVVFLQMNDVYEIAPLEGGKVGGLARVATIRDSLRKVNFNTLTVMAGDFLNPSVIGTLKYEGERIAGRQMIDVLNTMGLDLATFGNHEFDLSEADLLKRLRESRFGWVSSNAGHVTEAGLRLFPSGPDGDSVSPTYLFDLVDEDGTRVKIGVVAVTLPSNQKNYVRYSSIFKAAAQGYASLKEQTDFVVGLTHVTIEEDREISRQVPGLKLIMGGHEHDHMHHKVGDAVIAKADANAKTVYIHRLTYDHRTRQLDIRSELVPVDATVPFQPETQAVVRKWTGIAAQSFRDLGFDPGEVVMTATEPLDGREASIRHQPTNLTQLVVEAFTRAAPRSELTLLNSGSIRLDDQLTGNITQYDVLRTLPFGGKLLEADIRGDLLEKILVAGRANKGEGGYLQLGRVAYDEARKGWLVGGKLLQKNKTYRVALTAFLLTGGEKNLEFLKPENPGVVKVYEPAADDKSDPRTDIRLAVISYMRSLNR